MPYNKNIKQLFKTIHTLLPTKTSDDYKTKYHTTINALGGKWYIDKNISKLPPINRRRLKKKQGIAS